MMLMIPRKNQDSSNDHVGGFAQLSTGGLHVLEPSAQLIPSSRVLLTLGSYRGVKFRGQGARQPAAHVLAHHTPGDLPAARVVPRPSCASLPGHRVVYLLSPAPLRTTPIRVPRSVTLPQ
jgi:hypothetical protein